MATAFTAWYDDVMPHVPTCPLALALAEIREAAIAWCKHTRSWRYLQIAPIASVVGQQSYAPVLPANTQLVHVFQLNYLGRALDFATLAAFKAKSDTWFSDQGDPECFTLFNRGTVSLWKIPSSAIAGAIVLPDVALAPTETAVNVDDAIFTHARAAVAIGARARLHSTPGKPFTNLELGAALERQFQALMGAEDANVASGRGHARLRTQTIVR